MVDVVEALEIGLGNKKSGGGMMVILLSFRSMGLIAMPARGPWILL